MNYKEPRWAADSGTGSVLQIRSGHGRFVERLSVHKDDLSGGVYVPLASCLAIISNRRGNSDEHGVCGSSLRACNTSTDSTQALPECAESKLPAAFARPGADPAGPKKKWNRQNQAEMKAHVQKLYELIGELKEQIERSETNSTLSLSVVKKASLNRSATASPCDTRFSCNAGPA